VLPQLYAYLSAERNTGQTLADISLSRSACQGVGVGVAGIRILTVVVVKGTGSHCAGVARGQPSGMRDAPMDHFAPECSRLNIRSTTP
jgi:hypothetical protein